MKILKPVYFLVFVFVVFAAGLFSCRSAAQKSNDSTSNQGAKISDANTNQFNVAEFERNRRLWTSKNIQNYKMIVGASGFLTNFPEEVLIEVRNRQAKSIKSLSRKGNDGTQTYKNYDTIEKIFDFIERGKAADRLNVLFDENFGYPKRISYDGRKGYSDDELELQVKSLEVID